MNPDSRLNHMRQERFQNPSSTTFAVFSSEYLLAFLGGTLTNAKDNDYAGLADLAQREAHRKNTASPLPCTIY